ncbi:cell division protein FtsQ/DivIB [soil metagenome]
MFKKRIWRYLLIGFAWTVSLGGVVVLMSFIEVKKAEVLCRDVKVYIPGTQYFIDRQEVDKILLDGGRSLVGQKMERINIHQLEGKLKANPFIEYAKVYVEMDGSIMVEISQRQPILRLMNHFDQDFYVEQHGLKIPLSTNFTARVLVANGYIDELFANHVDTLHTQLAKDLFKTADFIRKDSLWDAQIAQMYVNKDHEIELIPRVGNNRILIGNAEDRDIKFINLITFDKKALQQVGWDTDKVVNVNYINQVVGVKNQTIKTDSLSKKSTATDSAKTDTSQIKK